MGGKGITMSVLVIAAAIASASMGAGQQLTGIDIVLWDPYSFGRQETYNVLEILWLEDATIQEIYWPDPLDLEDLLHGADVLVIPEQEGAPDVVELERLGGDVRAVLRDFLDRGGRIVSLSCGPGGDAILRGAGLTAAQLFAWHAGGELEAEPAQDSLLAGVCRSFTAPSGTVSFEHVDCDATVLLLSEERTPVAFRAPYWQGDIVFLGFDYYDPSNASARQLLANACNSSIPEATPSAAQQQRAYVVRLTLDRFTLYHDYRDGDMAELQLIFEITVDGKAYGFVHPASPMEVGCTRCSIPKLSFVWERLFLGELPGKIGINSVRLLESDNLSAVETAIASLATGIALSAVGYFILPAALPWALVGAGASFGIDTVVQQLIGSGSDDCGQAVPGYSWWTRDQLLEHVQRNVAAHVSAAPRTAPLDEFTLTYIENWTIHFSIDVFDVTCKGDGDALMQARAEGP